MSWQTLGTVNIGYEWVSLTPVLAQAEVFRITQTWNGDDVGVGKLVLGFLYPDGSYGSFRSLWPSRETQLIEILIPESFKEAGMVARTMRVKHNLYARIFANANWQARIEAFINLDIGLEDAPVFDGSEYLVDGGAYGE